MTNASTTIEVAVVARDQASSVFGDIRRQVDQQLGAIGEKAGVTGLSMRNLALATAAASAAFATFQQVILPLINAASAYEESLNKVRVVFGELSPEIEKFATSSTTALFLSQQAALEAAGTFGNLFTAMKLGPEASAKMSQGLVSLAVDLASFNNIGVDEALDKLRAGLVGEVEPLRTVGVNLSAAAVAARAAELGFQKVNGEFSAGAKAQAAYSLILEQTKTAQGDALRTADGYANSMRQLDAALENLKKEGGSFFLPIATEAVQGALEGLRALNAVLSITHETLRNMASVAGPALDALGIKSLGDAIGVVLPGVGSLRAAVDLLGGSHKDAAEDVYSFSATEDQATQSTNTLTAALAAQVNQLGLTKMGFSDSVQGVESYLASVQALSAAFPGISQSQIGYLTGAVPNGGTLSSTDVHNNLAANTTNIYGSVSINMPPGSSPADIDRALRGM